MNAIERFAAIAAIAAGLAPAAQAAYTIPKFRVNQYYDSNAVLQRGVTLPISGAAVQGRTVTVTFAGRTLSATADLESPYASDGEARWRVEFPAMEAGGPYTLTATDGTTTLTATNILVGEVWLASGQSNAYYPIERFADAAAWLQDADYPTIRFIEATENHFEWQLNQNAWQVASSATAGKCSAMGFFFAKELQGKLGVPVGIVTAAVDGSLIDEWLPGCTSAKDHYTKMILNSLEPVPPLPVRGVLWYQGESDGMFGFGYNYRFKLQSLVRNWRALWNDADMPFLVAQLPFYGAYGQWCDVRDSQNWVGRQEQGVHVVPTLDIGDLADIHPPKKPELGRRLSEFARKYVYGESGLYPEGPVYLRSEANPDNASEILVHFDAHTAITSGDGQPLRGFQVGGDYYGTTKFFDGTVRIVDADTLAVSCATFANPLAVRYGFANTDPVNFFDAEGNAARHADRDLHERELHRRHADVLHRRRDGQGLRRHAARGDARRDRLRRAHVLVARHARVLPGIDEAPRPAGRARHVRGPGGGGPPEHDLRPQADAHDHRAAAPRGVLHRLRPEATRKR